MVDFKKLEGQRYILIRIMEVGSTSAFESTPSGGNKMIDVKDAFQLILKEKMEAKFSVIDTIDLDTIYQPSK